MLIVVSPAKNLDFEWQIRNARTARKTNFATDIIFDAGDKIGIYVADQGTDLSSVTVTLYFAVIDDTEGEVIDNYSGNFATDSGGGS